MHENHPDYYGILGVEENATPEDIKNAYNRSAKKTHPDKGGNKDNFIEVAEAYKFLSDPVKRRMLDGDRALNNLYSGKFQKFKKILDDGAQALENKNLGIEDLYSTWRLLCRFKFSMSKKKVLLAREVVILNMNRMNSELNKKGSEFYFLEKWEKKLIELEEKFKERLLLRTREKILIFQDRIQEQINAAQVGVYEEPFEIKVIVNESRKESLETIVQTIPYGEYLEQASPSPSPSYVTFRVKTEYLSCFDNHAQGKVLELPERSDETGSSRPPDLISGYKSRLLEYIHERSPKEKYTGWRFGFSREEKTRAAQSLIDVLSGRLSPATFFDNKHKSNVKALKQGSLKAVAKDAMAYVNELNLNQNILNGNH